MQTKKICLASLSHFFCDLNTGALPALIPFLISAYGWSYSLVSALMLANSSLASVIQPMFGLLSDRKPRMWFMPLGILIAGLGMGCVGFLESYTAVFLAVGVSGIGAALFHPSGMRFTTLHAGDRQSTATSLFSIGGNTGFLFAPLLIAALMDLTGFQGLGLLCLVAVVMSAWIFFEARAVQPVRNIVAKAAQPSACSSEYMAPAGALPANNWKAFVRLTGAIVCRSVLMICLRVFVPLYWIARFAQSEAQAAFVLTVFGLSGIVGNILGGMLADRYGLLPVIRVSYALVVPLSFLLPVLDNFVLINIVLIATGLMLYASFSPVVVLGQRYLARNIGLASGITLGLGISAGGLFAPILGWIADTAGLVAVFYTLGSLAALGFVFSCLLIPVPVSIRPKH